MKKKKKTNQKNPAKHFYDNHTMEPVTQRKVIKRDDQKVFSALMKDFAL